jgi:uncharacterized protein YjbJ (UPF0337 family)
MSWTQIQNQWQQAQAKLRHRWEKLTDDDFDAIAGKRDQLVSTLQRKYGEARDTIDRQVKQFEDDYETM